MSAGASVSVWRCPFLAPCFEGPVPVYPTREAANEAVKAYQDTSPSPSANGLAEALYLGHVLVLRKALAHFCPESKCRPGACLVEELVGETVPIFMRALDEYDPTRGVDFLGYVSRRLIWGLRQRVRPLRKARALASAPQAPDLGRDGEDLEGQLIDRLHLQALMDVLSPDEAILLAKRYAEGFSGRELAESMGISYDAMRKRLQRLRARVRTGAEPRTGECKVTHR